MFTEKLIDTHYEGFEVDEGTSIIYGKLNLKGTSHALVLRNQETGTCA